MNNIIDFSKYKKTKSNTIDNEHTQQKNIKQMPSIENPVKYNFKYPRVLISSENLIYKWINTDIPGHFINGIEIDLEPFPPEDPYIPPLLYA